MKFNTLKDLEEAGFVGFVPVSGLKMHGVRHPLDVEADSCLDRPGVYMVVRQVTSVPEFVQQGTGGFFKGKNPNVPESELRAAWVNDTCVVYIGKAGGGTSGATLRKRIRQYVRFGSGETVGHWGGRYIWQLKDADDLLFCWKPASASEDAAALESALIADFKSSHGGRRPFANLRD